MTCASIVIPAHNAEKHIAGAVESALAQTYEDREVIVVDDGSEDGTRRILRPYAERGQIRHIRQRNSGPSTARNTGIANADGRYISFLDADDLLDPAYLKSVVAFFDDYPEIDFVFTNYELVPGSGATGRSGVDRWKIFRTIPHGEDGQGRWLFTGSLTKYIIRHGGFMTTSCVTVRADALKGGNVFREGFFYGEDDEFFARVNYRRRAGYLDRMLMKKNCHAGSLTRDKARVLTNVLHFLMLSEIQKDYFRGDEEIQAILRKKIPALVFDYCWRLIERRDFQEAQRVLSSYMRRYRKSLPLYKLLLKSYLYKWVGGKSNAWKAG